LRPAAVRGIVTVALVLTFLMLGVAGLLAAVAEDEYLDRVSLPTRRGATMGVLWL
jgi:hypothetical protein